MIGDGTFTHSGMAPLLDAARENTDIKVFILDNSIVAMTGGQPTMATDEQVVDLVAGLGVPRERIRVVSPVPQKKAENVRVIRDEIAHHGAVGDHRPPRLRHLRQGHQGAPARAQGDAGMNFDLVVCGVGGQGVLSIAWVVDQAAVEAGFHLKQPEVHGMAQRGGAVSAFVRIVRRPDRQRSHRRRQRADMVLSVEPMESLRYAQAAPPRRLDRHRRHAAEERGGLPRRREALYDVLFAVPRLVAVDAARARAPQGGDGEGAQHGDAGRRRAAAAACRRR